MGVCCCTWASSPVPSRFPSSPTFTPIIFLPSPCFHPILFPSFFLKSYYRGPGWPQTSCSNKDDLDTLIPLTPPSSVPTGGGLGEWCCSGFIQRLSGYVILMGPVSPGSISWCPFSFSIPLKPTQSQVPLLLRVRRGCCASLCTELTDGALTPLGFSRGPSRKQGNTQQIHQGVFLPASLPTSW